MNDAGTQTDIFAETLYVRYQQLFGREVEMPEGGYPGEAVVNAISAAGSAVDAAEAAKGAWDDIQAKGLGESVKDEAVGMLIGALIKRLKGE